MPHSAQWQGVLHLHMPCQVQVPTGREHSMLLQPHLHAVDAGGSGQQSGVVGQQGGSTLQCSSYVSVLLNLFASA